MMNILLLRGIGCDYRVLEPLDLGKHTKLGVDYHAILSESTDSIEGLARALNEYLDDHTFDAVVAHSMGGILGALMISQGFIDTEVFIAIEKPSFHKKPHTERCFIRIRVKQSRTMS